MKRMRILLPALLLALLLVGLIAPAAAWPASAQEPVIVSTVNGDPISQDALYGRIRLVRWQYLREIEAMYEGSGGLLNLVDEQVTRIVNDLNDPVRLGSDVLHEMEEERLLWQTGESLGVTPTAEDAKAYEDSFFSTWTAVPAEQLAQNSTAQEFITQWYADATAASGMSAADIRFLFETEALRARLYQQLSQNVPQQEMAVQTRHVLCSFHPDNPADLTPPTDEQRATAVSCIQAAQVRLANGEPFGVVAADLSADEASAIQGGNVGWSLLSYLADTYANAVRDAELNTVIGPVETEYGLHLIEVMDRKMQTLTDAEYQNSVTGYFRLWVQSLWDQATVERTAGWDATIPTDPALDSLSPTILEAVNRVVGS
jgi:hypothetical protein